MNLVVSGGVVREARIVLGAVSPTPRRAREAEALMIGAGASPELAARAAGAALAGATPLAHNAYKVRLAKVMVERALREAMA